MGDFSNYMGTGEFPSWTTQSVGGGEETNSGFLGGVSKFLGNPSNQAMMLSMAKGLSSPRVVGGHLVPTTGMSMADSMLPIAQGKIANQGIQGAAEATGAAANPNDTLSADNNPTPLSELNKNPGLTGITVTPTKEGMRYDYKSHGPKEAAEANVINAQLQQGQPSLYMGTGSGGTRVSAGLGNQNPTVSPGTAGGQGFAGVPAEYVPTFRAMSAKYNVPVGLLIGIAKNETRGFNPAAVSPKGALGLMQVMPGTGRDMGYTPEQLLNPHTSIEASAKYLASLRDQHQIDLNNPVMAASAYNGGPAGMQNADPRYVQAVNRDSVVGPEIGNMYAQNMPAQPTMVDIPQSTVTPYRAPDYSKMPDLTGLTPEQVHQVYQTGANIARTPATIAAEMAGAEHAGASAQATRLGLPLLQPQRYTLPNGLTITANGKEIMDFEKNMAQLRSLEAYRQSEGAKWIGTAELAKMQADEKRAQTEARDQLISWGEKNNVVIAMPPSPDHPEGQKVPFGLIARARPEFLDRWITGMYRLEGQQGVNDLRGINSELRANSMQLHGYATMYKKPGVVTSDGQGGYAINFPAAEGLIADMENAAKTDPSIHEQIAEVKAIVQRNRELRAALQGRNASVAPTNIPQAPQVPQPQVQLPFGVPQGAIPRDDLQDSKHPGWKVYEIPGGGYKSFNVK